MGEIRGYCFATVQKQTEWQAGAPHEDFTTFDGWSSWQSVSFGQIPAGMQVSRIIGPMQSRFTYVDDDPGDDVFLPVDDALVSEFRFVGDRNQLIGGSDSPSVRVVFQNIRIEVVSG